MVRNFLSEIIAHTFPSYHLLNFKRFRRYIPLYLSIVKPKKIKNEADKSINKSKEVPKESEEIPDSTESQENVITHNYFNPLKALELLRLFHRSLPTDEQSKTGFVTLNLILKVDTSRTSIRGSMTMPHPVGPSPRVLAICDPSDSDFAISNGATYAGLDTYIDKIASGWMDFDRIVCTPQYMPQLLKVARILGPAKMMPTFKSGTLVTNLTEALQALSSCNSLQYRTESVTSTHHGFLLNSPHGELTASIGMLSQSDKMLMENIQFFIKEIAKKRPVEDVKKSSSNSFQWPPPNFVSPRLQESRMAKLQRHINLLEQGSAKAIDLSTFFISSSIVLSDTAIPPIYMRVV